MANCIQAVLSVRVGRMACHVLLATFSWRSGTDLVASIVTCHVLVVLSPRCAFYLQIAVAMARHVRGKSGICVERCPEKTAIAPFIMACHVILCTPFSVR